MHKWHAFVPYAFVLYLPDDGDLPPKQAEESISMDDMRFYIKWGHLLVHMDSCVKYFSYVNNWKYCDYIIV
jgi:hypothetical protein